MNGSLYYCCGIAALGHGIDQAEGRPQVPGTGATRRSVIGPPESSQGSTLMEGPSLKGAGHLPAIGCTFSTCLNNELVYIREGCGRVGTGRGNWAFTGTCPLIAE